MSFHLVVFLLSEISRHRLGPFSISSLQAWATLNISILGIHIGMSEQMMEEISFRQCEHASALTMFLILQNIFHKCYIDMVSLQCECASGR